MELGNEAHCHKNKFKYINVAAWASVKLSNKYENQSINVGQPKFLFTTINSESGLAFSTDARCADLHGLGDLGFLCSLSSGLWEKKIN